MLSASKKSRLDIEIPFAWPWWGPCVSKWLFTIIVAMLVLCGAVASRMALIAIPKAKSGGNNGDMFLALVLVIMVPYLVEFLRCLWLHGVVPGHDWPSPIAIFIVSISTHTITMYGTLLHVTQYFNTHCVGYICLFVGLNSIEENLQFIGMEYGC